MYNPLPKIEPRRLPRQLPKRVVPSYIGEAGQVGNWLFYNGAGDKLYDFSGEGNHGTINGPKWVDGSFGWALEFDGVDDVVNVPDSPELKPDYITAMCWFYSEEIPFSGHSGIICKGSTDTRAPWLWGYSGESKVHGEVYNTAGASSPIISPALSVNTWYHIALVFDGSNCRMYLNGSEVASSSLSGTMADTTGYDYHFGLLEGYHYLDGIIGEVRIYDRALTATEISQHFEETRVFYGV